MKIAKFITMDNGNKVELHRQPMAATPNKVPFDRANTFTFNGKQYALHHVEDGETECKFILVKKR